MVDFFFTGFVFAFGLIFGSFFNVLIFRLNSEEKWVPRFWQGRSVCPQCRKQIGWFDNIPLLSFFLLGGKCRNCQKPISWQYPMVEFVTGVVTVLIVSPEFLSQSPTQLTPFFLNLAFLVIAYSFIVIFFSDLLFGLIPDEMIIFGIVVSGVFQFWQGSLRENILTASIAALAFFIIVLVTKFRGMGLGDVKLAFFLGLFLGWPATAVGLWIAFVFGGVFSVILIALKRSKFSATIPLGPFLIIGAAISAIWSTKILQLVGFL